jgi:hypothetical protein
MAFKTNTIQVDGSINIDGSIFQWNLPFTGGGGSQWTTNGTAIYYNSSVGIGTSSPATKFEVLSGLSNSEIARFGSTVSARGIRISSFIVGGTNEVGFNFNAPGAGGSAAISFSTLSNEIMRVTENNVGIGTASPFTKFETAAPGVGYWNGSTDWTSQSPPLSTITVSNTTTGGYDSAIVLRQTDSSGVTKNSAAIGVVGTSSWGANNNGSQLSDMYFAVRNNSGGISERIRIGSGGNFYVKALASGSTSNSVYYNSGTGEMTYAAAGAPDISTLNIDSYVDASVLPDPSLLSVTARGTFISLTAAETITTSKLIYINSSGRAAIADADASNMMPAVGIYEGASVSAGSVARFLINGVYRETGLNFAIGKPVYVGTDGSPTTTAPSTATDCVQVVGISVSPKSMIFNPSLDFVVLK